MITRSCRQPLLHFGMLVLLENVRDFEARFVFPHNAPDWVEMVERAGVRLCGQWGTN